MLTPTQKQMIDLAAESFKYSGSLEVLARERFDLSPTRFWQEVNHLIATEAGLTYSPAVIARLKRRRHERERPRLTSRILN